MSKIRLGIADDNRDFCDILTDFFHTQENIEIVFVAHDGIETLDCVKKYLPEILVLDMELLDTRQKSGNLTGTLIADLVLQILAYVAQTEREFINQRQAEGIAAAKRNGKKFGRPEKEMPDRFQEICQRCREGEISTRQAAELLCVSHTTFSRRYKKIVEETVSNSRHFGTSE